MHLSTKQLKCIATIGRVLANVFSNNVLIGFCFEHRLNFGTGQFIQISSRRTIRETLGLGDVAQVGDKVSEAEDIALLFA